ncbi:PREDICTED: noggin-1-like [Gekko japonicus]|uniref:Noggin n=1 Tax=Gekko japonicus TaxID=146911 RepID=A0ABM1JJ17_GEKJA|nr:PREDICTED: noggin-1-like [Gekko japonicus]
MDARAWLLCMLLLGLWAHRSHRTGAVSLPQERDLSLSEATLPQEKSLEIAQYNPDIHLIRSKPSNQARPYSLSLSPDDYHYSPKPKRLRTPRLMKMLGSSFDPFWMSFEDPRSRNTSLEELGTLSEDLTERTARLKKKLLQEAQGLDLLELLTSEDGIPHNQSQALKHRLQQWLVDSATCHLTSSWVDLGPIFWPRWVRHTDCDPTHAGCSWPPGMTCQHSQVTHIKLLAWHCWASKEEAVVPRKPPQQCAWRQIPYPVVAACKCSCQ